jgi:hypothetical protein
MITKNFCKLPLLVVPVLIAFGCAKKEAPSKPIDATRAASIPVGGEETRPSKGNPAIDPDKPDFTLSAKEYFAQCKKDKEAAKKFIDKTIELTGTVRRAVGEPLRDIPQIMLNGGTDTDIVQCLTKDKQPFVKVSPGQSIKLTGKCNADSVKYATLVDCVIVEAGPNKAQTKYDGKYVIIHGEISAVSAKDRRLTLKQEGSIPIYCSYAGSDAEYFERVKAGQKLRVFGECGVTDDYVSIGIDSCIFEK